MIPGVLAAANLSSPILFSPRHACRAECACRTASPFIRAIHRLEHTLGLAEHLRLIGRHRLQKALRRRSERVAAIRAQLSAANRRLNCLSIKLKAFKILLLNVTKFMMNRDAIHWMTSLFDEDSSAKFAVSVACCSPGRGLLAGWQYATRCATIRNSECVLDHRRYLLQSSHWRVCHRRLWRKRMLSSINKCPADRAALLERAVWFYRVCLNSIPSYWFTSIPSARHLETLSLERLRAVRLCFFSSLKSFFFVKKHSTHHALAESNWKQTQSGRLLLGAQSSRFCSTLVQINGKTTWKAAAFCRHLISGAFCQYLKSSAILESFSGSLRPRISVAGRAIDFAAIGQPWISFGCIPSLG